MLDDLKKSPYESFEVNEICSIADKIFSEDLVNIILVQ